MTKNIQEIYASRVAQGEIVPDPAQEALLPCLEHLRHYLNSTPEPRGLRKLFTKEAERPKGIYLWGGVGRGKSMLMDLLVGSLDVPNRRVHFHSFMQEIHAGMHEARKTGVDDALKPVALGVANDIRLLAFDEVQINDITDAMIVGRLFEQLFAEGVIIVTTSNRPPDGLYENGLNRALFEPFIDLLKSQMQVHELASAQDYRQQMLVGKKSYFSPVNSSAEVAINKIWQDVAGNPGEKLVLNVKGHEVIIPRFSNGVGRAKFWDLCAKPYGPADYLALADRIRLLILEDIPTLGRSNYNEAKRFVTLIDALYEAQVRIVISAADVPEQLYVEGAGSFEFERTASRLREMQSDDWGQDAP